MPSKKDSGRVPAKNWKFDAGVTDVFDDMLRRSIPEHDRMRDAVFALGSRYVREGTSVVDLGCSRGAALAPFVEKFVGRDVDFLGFEASPPMVWAATKRFAKNDRVKIANHDLRAGLPARNASLVLSVLTLQFVPINYRSSIVSQIFDSLAAGGAFIFVEKVMGEQHQIDRAMVDAYHGLKRENGYTDEDVKRKSMSLEGVLVPLTAKMNEAILRGAGFAKIDCFWRWMNFSGWIAVK